MCYNNTMHKQNREKPKRILWCGIALAISMALTPASMVAIKNTPGNSFSSGKEFIATTILVLVLWFLGILGCIWLISYLVSIYKMKKSPSDIHIEKVAEKTKTAKTAKKVFIGFLNVATAYFLVIFSAMTVIFSGLGTPNAIWWAFAIMNICILLPTAVCAIMDLTMAIRLWKNPDDGKAFLLRAKAKRIFRALILVYICLYLLTFCIIIMTSVFQ